METLPPNSVNALINGLLFLFFTDAEVRTKMGDVDGRFVHYEPAELKTDVPAVAQKPAKAPQPSPPPQESKPAPLPIAQSPAREKVEKPVDSVEKKQPAETGLLDSLRLG
jgi:hypothetical protein